MEDVFERFARWYLRLNGYFTIENFYVHAAGDGSRISKGMIGALTESDLLGVRMPYSSENAGGLSIGNHDALIADERPRLDFVIGEVKSGNQNTPNRCWRGPSGLPSVMYLVRFLGQFPECRTEEVATGLLTSFRYADVNCRIRYIIFAERPNKAYVLKGVCYITYDEIVKFLVDIRGQCWARGGLGVTSLHEHWDPLINRVFEIAHSQAPSSDRHRQIAELIAGSAAAK